MAKRRQFSSAVEAPRKRPRVVHEAPTFEEVHSARQLMQLLAFDQDLQKARHGLQSFKVFLDKLSDPATQTPADAALLRSYLEAMPPRPAAAEDNEDDAGADAGAGAGADAGGGGDPTYLPDIMDTWAYASRMGNDNVVSAVAVVLALLVRYLSRVLDLAPVGLGLCRTLLRRRQLELVARNLSADRGKEFVLSPTLRLLREVVAFDGGAVAKPLFRARNFTLRSLARNMSLKSPGEGLEDARRTSVRTNAVRFLLAALRFLHPEAKAELLGQREVVAALTRSIKDDPPALVLDILRSLREDVLQDKKLPRSARVRLFNAATLTRLAGLYAYPHDHVAIPPSEDGGGGGGDNSSLSISDTAHRLLLHVCTSPSVGVLREQTGYYPQGVEPNTDAVRPPGTANNDDDGDDGDDGDDELPADVSLDRIVWMDKFADDVPVFNLALAEFIPTLRPWSSTRQSELLLAIFRGAPELVAWYYLDKKNFSFDPKLSATWVGFAALLFRTVQTEVPAFFGNRQQRYARVPPPTSVVVDNLLPRPLTQKTLARCIAHKSKLVSFFAVRILALALEKLRRALQMHRAAARAHPREALWREAARRVADEFCRRCPPLKEVLAAYRAAAGAGAAAGEDDLLCREAASRVLRLYYEVVPQVALGAKFDVAAPLVAAIRRVADHPADAPPPDKALKRMELEHLLAIAGYSPGMQWFSKAKGLAASPFAALLRVLAEEAAGDRALGTIRQVLDFVARDQQLVLSPDTGLAALLDSLNEGSAGNGSGSGGGLLSDPVWALVDNCVVRCANAPIKYLEMLQEDLAPAATATATAGDGPPAVDPITMALAEQLRFATEQADEAARKRLAAFFAAYLQRCRGDRASLQPIADRVVSAFPTGSAAGAHLAKKLPKLLAKRRAQHSSSSAAAAALPHPLPPPAGAGADSDGEGVGAAAAPGELQAAEETPQTLEALLDLPAVPPSADVAALSRWGDKAADTLVEEGYAAAVVWLLAAEDGRVRAQALVNLTTMAARIRASAYDEREQVWLLLAELVESAKAWMTDAATADRPLPSPVVAFAARALDVLRNPLHCLYAKVNAFLTAGPVWRSLRSALPLVRDVVRDGPTDDDTYYAELAWLLAYLLDSLRTPADVDAFRARRLFETLGSLAANPYMRFPLRRQVLRILARATAVDGGSTTLVTRCGIVSWLAARQAALASSSGRSGQGSGSAGRAARDLDAAGLDGGLDDTAEARIVQALLQRLWDTCDRSRVDSWSMHGVQETVAAAVRA